MSTFSEINSGLIKAVANMGLLPVQYEAIQFESKTPFIAMHILPVDADYHTLGDQGCDLHRGLLQLTVCYPDNKGTTAAYLTADSINEYFYSQRVFTMTTLNVRIRMTKVERLLHVDGWIRIPVSIEYYAYTPRITA